MFSVFRAYCFDIATFLIVCVVPLRHGLPAGTCLPPGFWNASFYRAMDTVDRFGVPPPSPGTRVACRQSLTRHHLQRYRLVAESSVTASVGSCSVRVMALHTGPASLTWPIPTCNQHATASRTSCPCRTVPRELLGIMRSLAELPR